MDVNTQQQMMLFVFLLLIFHKVPINSIPMIITVFNHIWHFIKASWIIGTNFDTKQTFNSDTFASIAILVAKTPYCHKDIGHYVRAVSNLSHDTAEGHG